MILKQTFLLLLITTTFFQNVIAQDTLNPIKLISGNKTKIISPKRVLILDMEDKNKISGEFLYKSKSNIVIRPYAITFADGQHKFFSEKTDSTIHLDFNKINKLTAERDVLQTTTVLTFYASITTAFIISPLVSIKKGGGFDLNKCLTISGISLGSAILSAGVFILFDQKAFYLKPISKKKRIWTIKE